MVFLEVVNQLLLCFADACALASLCPSGNRSRASVIRLQWTRVRVCQLTGEIYHAVALIGEPLIRPLVDGKCDLRAACDPAVDLVTWLILPVVICLSQRLSHACLSISFHTAKLQMAH